MFRSSPDSRSSACTFLQSSHFPSTPSCISPDRASRSHSQQIHLCQERAAEMFAELVGNGKTVLGHLNTCVVRTYGYGEHFLQLAQRLWGMPQLVKCLLFKHENLNLILGWIRAGEAETVESWKLSS